jgi:hypothetical protein
MQKKLDSLWAMWGVYPISLHYYTFYLKASDMFVNAQAELRANVFQAIEEQDREAENNGASSFALLGKCSERAKQLHASHAGT